ncbi:TIM-barrel domain-containing protein [Pseudomaricurvus alkylphenolicus]|uniref:glycoside hydrolase family 31 protein n=1 Tax=Pseudomaricurvus alkylphenolicus TaxID=1306991 RepID=UPI00198164C0|nr:TIM-barrel domain-containing protein [Pseudomaricurvus alkylphenolicus]
MTSHFAHPLKFPLFFIVFLALSVVAEEQRYLSHKLVDNVLQLQTNQHEIRLKPHSGDALEVRYRSAGLSDNHRFPSHSLVTPRDTEVNLIEHHDRIEFSLTGLKAVIQKQPFQIAYYQNGELLLAEEQGFFQKEAALGFRFKLQDHEKLMGTGQRVLGMDRRGHRLPLYNKASYGYTTQAEQMYYGLPAVLSTNKYILLFDNTAKGSLDLGKQESDILQFEAVSGRSAYVVVAGESYAQLVQNYVAATGYQPLPSRWVFGSFASRFGYHTEAETRDVVQRYQQQNIPLDAVVLDLYWFGADVKGHMGNLAWDRQAFPEPKQMIADFREQGVDTVLITEPFILSSSTRWEEAVREKVLATDEQGEPYRFDFYFGNTGLIDLFDERARDWFWNIYDELLKQGVTGLWGDLGEPEVHPADIHHKGGSGDELHNVYGHRWAQMLFERSLQAYPERRPMIMMRSGFAGSQRYGMIPWTGDVSRSWGGLQPQVELSLQMGLLGLAYTHSDLGGFAGGDEFDPELYTRWLQFGVFQPVFRPHAQENIAPEPVFHSVDIQDMARDQINLRYRLLPYLYTMAWENSVSGMPLARPLMFADESDPTLIDNTDSYLWGDSLLITPVTRPGVDSQQVHLPAGIWFDFHSDKRIKGGRTVDIDVDLKAIPVMVKAGAFIPMLSHNIANTKQYSTRDLTLHYYADRSVKASSGHMYDDDGKTHQAFNKEQYELLNFEATQSAKSLTISLQREGYAYEGRPASRQIQLQVHNWRHKPKSVRVDGQRLDRKQIHYDRKARLLTLSFSWDGERRKVRIQ